MSVKPVGGDRAITCPACGGPSLYGPQNPWRPFCSERCKNHDFGAWASERYRVPAQREPADEGGGEDPPADH